MKAIKTRGLNMKCSNKDAREYVQQCKPFKANNLFAELRGDTYIVFSYGYHWILFVCKGGVWYENKEKYSVTTGKHRSQANPRCETLKVSHEEIRKFY